MAIIYVDKSGSDANNGSTLALAKLTVHAAAAIAVDGDRVEVGEGDFVENSGSGYLDFNKSGLTVGITIYSRYPKRMAVISGTSAAWSTRVTGNNYTFCDIDFKTCPGCLNGAIAADSTVIANLTLIRCNWIVAHKGNYCARLTSVGTTLKLLDVNVINQTETNVGAYVNAAIVIIDDSNINAFAAGGGVGLFIGVSVQKLKVANSKLRGDYAVRSSVSIVDADLVFAFCNIKGIRAAGNFDGAVTGKLQRIISRFCVGIGENLGWSIQGSNGEIDEHGSDYVSGNVALGMPGDGAYTNSRGRASDFSASGHDMTVGHALLCGDGSVNSEISNGSIVGRKAKYAFVVKGTGRMRNCTIEGGTIAALFMKATDGWVIEDNEITNNDGGSAFFVGVEGFKSQDNVAKRNIVHVLNGGLFYASGDPAVQANNLFDENIYNVVDSGSWGTVNGVAVASLDDVQSAWPNDADSIEGATSQEVVTKRIAGVRAKTDNLPANPAAVGDEMAATKESVRAAVAGRWRNQGTGTGYDDIAIEDTP